MKQYRVFSGILAAVLALSWGSCGDEDSDTPQPVVKITGSYSVEVGKSLALGATTERGTDTSYTWKSNDETIATVDADGKVTGVKAGETLIVATGADTKKSGEHPLVVIGAGGGVTPDGGGSIPDGGTGGVAAIVVSGAPFVLSGATIKLTARTVNGTDTGYDWTSSDELVAKVADDGTVTGVASGVATITAKGRDTAAEGAMALMVGVEVPNSEKWRTSGHADTTAEAFNHWNADDPAEIPTTCARCHSTPGFLDFIGADGSEAGKVDQAAPIGTTIGCTACHNDAASKLSSVTFPSGVTIGDLGPEARCMTCHQGNASADSVDKAITDAAAATDDTASDKLGFINIHYYAAGATLEAGRVRGGYQYAGKTYDWRFRHVPGKDTCVECHDAHSLKVRVEDCAACHAGVKTADDAKKIRMIASAGRDYDGDGDLTEGIYGELDGLRTVLFSALQTYAGDNNATKLCYDQAAYPYFFKDTDGDGKCSATEAVFANAYDKWTPRLLRAAYNYQVSLKDPGAYAHNAKYIIQLLYDAIENLNAALTTKIDLSKLVRNDPGHFNGAGEAARHWDEDDGVSADCSKCHGGSEGLRFFLQYGVGKVVPEQDNGLDCATCHESLTGTFDLVAVDKVTFPGGKTITDPGSTSNLCGTCHSGRESKATVDARIKAGSLGFRNIHYFPAAATRAGSAAQVGYEYDGKTYAGPSTGHLGGDGCVDCHKPKQTNHSFAVKDAFASACTTCHAGAAVPEDIRASKYSADTDGDGDTSESLRDELAGLAAALLTQLQTIDKICYDGHSYPYFFIDTDGDGACSTTEAVSANSFKAWTPALMKATFNFQYFQKEPGAWAHNFDYLAQLLIDAIADLGGDVSKFTRP